jgi:23S rRNA (adenine2503-C2)-methyltransferase
MTDLPENLRERLAASELARTACVTAERRAADGTRKLVILLRDGATVETVLIPGVTGARAVSGGDERRGDERQARLPSPLPSAVAASCVVDADAAAADQDEDDEPDGASAAPAAGRSKSGESTESDPSVRVTQCISTQVGCAMGCVFCASGVAGLKRHLGADEIVGQILVGRAHLSPGERLSNVVFMGMGEPLHNYEATARTLLLLTHPEGICLSARRVTVSTSGLVPEIARLGRDFAGNVGLAVSLHAADDETRSRLMPINRKYPLAALMAALRAYPLPRRRRITIEYILVGGRNDTPAEASRLAKLLRGLPVKVNLIPMNPISASPLGPPNMQSVLSFQKVLCDAGYSCFIRRRRGDDVSAACGQLVLLGARPKVRVNRTL